MRSRRGCQTSTPAGLPLTLRRQTVAARSPRLFAPALQAAATAEAQVLGASEVMSVELAVTLGGAAVLAAQPALRR